MKPTKPSLASDRRGAVLAEFVLVIAPVLTMLFVFSQLGAMSIARLMVRHSAIIAARTAAVYSNTGDNLPESEGDGAGEVEQAAKAALGSWADNFASVAVTVEDQSNRAIDGQYGMVDVRVTAAFKCEVPLGRVICANGQKVMVDKKSLPHQGARYRK